MALTLKKKINHLWVQKMIKGALKIVVLVASGSPVGTTYRCNEKPAQVCDEESVSKLLAGQTHPRMFVGKKRGLERLRCPELALHAGAGGGVGRRHARRCHLVPCRWCWRGRTGAGCTPRVPALTPGRTRYVARERRQLSERNRGLILRSSSRRVALSLISTQWDLSASSLTAKPSTGLSLVSDQAPSAARGAQWLLQLHTHRPFRGRVTKDLKSVNTSSALRPSPWSRLPGSRTLPGVFQGLGFQDGALGTCFTPPGFRLPKCGSGWHPENRDWKATR